MTQRGTRRVTLGLELGSELGSGLGSGLGSAMELWEGSRREMALPLAQESRALSLRLCRPHLDRCLQRG